MGCNICKQQLGNEEQQEIKANLKKPQEKINNNNNNNDFHTNSNGLMNSNYYNNNFNSEKSPSINGLSSKFYDESSNNNNNNNNGKFKVTANFNNEVDSNFISHNNIYSNNSNNNNSNNNNNNLISFSKENNKNSFNNNNNYNSNEKIIDFNSNYNNYDILSQNSNQINPKNNNNNNNNNNKEIIKSSIPIEISENINNNEKISYDPNLEPNDEFSRYIFHELNNIRQNPQNYIDLITKSESNILKDKKNRLIYKSKVKVALNKGLPSFEETINFLKNLQPMNRLYYLPKLTVDIPTTEEEIKDKNYLKAKVGEKIEEGINIKSYWRDIINDAETSFLLMIVDDTGMKPGMKRKNIFDSNMKFIGISSISINKYFACYIVFSDRDN
jgi:hypothetical protein